MAVTNKKPILVDQPILEGLQRLRDDECRRSTVGATKHSGAGASPLRQVSMGRQK